MSDIPAIRPCDNFVSTCQDALTCLGVNETRCLSAQEAIDLLPSVFQEPVCWTGNLGLSLENRWVRTFNGLGYYGSYLGDWAGYAGQAFWLTLTYFVVKAIAQRVLGSRNEVTTQTTTTIPMSEKDLTKYMLQNKMIPRKA